VGLKPRGGGLRAGRYAEKGKTIALTGLTFAPGFSLTGSVSRDVRASGTLKVAAGGNSGSLTLKAGVLSGTLGGTAVRATVARLKIPAAGARRQAP
jgi:hypothetical protein